MQTQIITLLFWLGISLGLQSHEFHLSKTTINYDSEERAVQVSTRIFLDDLELALKESGFDSLKICTRKEKENVDDLIDSYLRSHLNVQVDGMPLTFTYLGKEQSNDLIAVWCYLEAYDVEAFSEISINNSILTAQFDDQKNITMVQIDKERIAHLLFTVDHLTEVVNP